MPDVLGSLPITCLRLHIPTLVVPVLLPYLKAFPGPLLISYSHHLGFSHG